MVDGAGAPIRAISEPEAVYPEAFSLVRGIRELSDGRLLVADPLSQVLLLADLETGLADTLGSVGPGPGEYRQPDGLFALPGDSTLLVDLGNARLTVIAPDGSFAETMPMTQSSGGPGQGMLILIPRGVDEGGGIYFQPFGSPRAGIPDSAVVSRYQRGSGVVDTVAWVKLPEIEQRVSGGGSDRQVRLSPVPLSPEDAWAVAPDGRVAIVRSPDYRLDWVEPDGVIREGERIDYDPVRIGRAEKEEWASGAVGGLRVSMTVDNGQRRLAFSRGGDSGAGPDIDALDWPKVMPPILGDGIWVRSCGEVWVQRSRPAGEAPVIDIFGADARVKARVSLPEGREIVGFGPGTLYLVGTDDLGLQWLERYSIRG